MSDRTRSLVIPREHGAWGMLLVPLLTGALVALPSGEHPLGLLPFAIVALALFWLRTPVESWAGTAPVRARTARERTLVQRATVVLAAVAAAGLVALFWGGRNRGLVWIGCGTGVAFLLQALLRWNWRGARTAAQMIGAAGLTSTSAAAYYVIVGHLDVRAWSLWAANLLFALNQISYVQLRIHAARAATRSEKLTLGRGFCIGQMLLAAVVAAACAAGVFPWTAAAAFAPILYRGFAWFAVEPRPLVIRALGKSELLYACSFGVLLVIGFLLP